MKRKSIFGFGVLIFMISTGVLLMACPHGSGEPPVSDLEVKPTKEADPDLAGTLWRSSKITEKIGFFDKGNIARFFANSVLYSINGSTISFDMSKSLAIWKNITVDTYPQVEIQQLESEIAKLKKAIDQENDHEKKKDLETELTEKQRTLDQYKNRTDEEKKGRQKWASNMKRMSAALEPYAKFSGTFNADKTQLTIENLPVYAPDKNKVNKVEKAVFTKVGP